MAYCPIVIPPNYFGYGFNSHRSIPPGDEYIEVIYKSVEGNFRVKLEDQAKKMKPELEYQGKQWKAYLWREPGDEWQTYVDRRYNSRLLWKPAAKEF